MEHELTLLVWAIIVTISLIVLTILIIKLQLKHKDDLHDMELTIKKEREDATDRSRYILKGKIGEQISPLLPEFYSKYEPADARFIGSPIDYVIFKNMSNFENNDSTPIEITLLDIKTGKSASLTDLQKGIKSAIEEGRVSFDVIKPNTE